MPIASFEEEQKLIQETSGAQSQHFLGMSGWLVREGFTTNQRSADLTLLVLAGLILVITTFVVFKFSMAPKETGLQSPPPSGYDSAASQL